MKREFRVDKERLEEVIEMWILNERNRHILKRRLIDGICFEPLADEFQLSVRQTKNIVYKCEDEIMKHL